jgi:hypothetical protein
MIILKKRLRRAKFKGCTFYLNETVTDIGRRTVIQPLPFQEKPRSKDFGKQPQLIQIQGFVSGATYRSDAEKLIKACEEKGSGELFHPYYGTRRVVCRAVRISESNFEGGIVYFSFSFSETNETAAGKFGLGNIPILGALLSNEVLENATKVLEETIDYANLFPTALDEVNDSLLMTAENFEKAFSPLLHTKESLENLQKSINELKNTVKTTFFHSTIGIVNAFVSVIRQVTGEPTAELDPYHWLNFYPPERYNFAKAPEMKIYLVEGSAILSVQLGQTLPTVNEKSPEIKLKALRVLKGNVDQLLSHAESEPQLHSSLKSIQALCVEQIFTQTNSSPHLVAEERPGKCLILEAYQKHGGLDAVNELMAQYHYLHPCFP